MRLNSYKDLDTLEELASDNIIVIQSDDREDIASAYKNHNNILITGKLHTGKTTVQLAILKEICGAGEKIFICNAANREELDRVGFPTSDDIHNADYVAVSELPIFGASELSRQGKPFIAASHFNEPADGREYIPDNTLWIHMYRDKDNIMRGSVLKRG